MASENEIEELRRMLESRSTDYGKMRQILAWYMLGASNEIASLRAKLNVVEEICNREIACRQKIVARCEKCRDDFEFGEDCPYHGEPCGCNSPTYGEFPVEKECEHFEEILSAIREKGSDPCNARDEEGSSLRIGWEGEKEYCVVAKYRQDLQLELEDYDFHRVTGPLTLDTAKHWLDYHKRIRTKSEDPKILVREVSKWRVFDEAKEGGAK